MDQVMRPTLGILALFTLVSAQAQSWCPPGAIWSYASQISQYPTNRIIRYTGDTIVDGHGSKHLLVVDQYINPNTQLVDTFGLPAHAFTRLNDDVVWLWSETHQAWDTMYWFGAEPGDFWTPPFATPGECELSGTGDLIHVVDTGTVEISGLQLRYWDIDLGWYDGRITERTGWSVAFAPFPGCWSDVVYSLTCYADEDVSYATTSEPNTCFLTTQVLLTDKRNFDLFPNPGTTHFNLNLPPGPHTITLLDATGRMVLEQRTADARPVIGTEHLSAGMYRITVQDDRGDVMGATWVKER